MSARVSVSGSVDVPWSRQGTGSILDCEVSAVVKGAAATKSAACKSNPLSPTSSSNISVAGEYRTRSILTAAVKAARCLDCFEYFLISAAYGAVSMLQCSCLSLRTRALKEGSESLRPL